MLDLAVRGGTVVTADAMRDADVGIADGRIAELGAVGDAREELDAAGLLVLPGLVDAHTHLDAQFRPNGPRTADDFYSGTVAAACGGVTTIVDYARQWPGQTLADGLAEWQARAAGNAVIDYSFHLVVTDFSDRSLADVPAVLADGFPSVKAFMMRVTDGELLRLMRAAAEAGGLVMAHAENAWVLEDRKQELFAAGKRSARWYVESRPELGEAEATSRAIDYADLTGATVCVVHLSCDAALGRVRAAKAGGSRAWAEVRPCYLLLDAGRYTTPGAEPLEYSGCPPLRPAWNLDRLWAGLADWTLDVVGSDHCAWTIEEKSVGADDFSRIPHGIPALETELPSLWTAGVGVGKVTATRLVEAMATAPARLHGLYPRKGTIAVGSDADLVLFDPKRRETIAQARLHSRAGYEPCEGMDCTGWPVLTLSRGEVIAQDGTFVGASGRGLLLRREPPPR
jgi:dihydropyrimidinase